MTVLDPTEVPPSPWRNGAGTTRELAAGPDREGGDGAVGWRISLAELGADAPFSSFPGMERLFVALGELVLSVDGVAQTCQAGNQLRFAGEAAAAVGVPAPTQALNVMTCRGRFRAQVVLRSAGEPAAGAPGDEGVMLVHVLLGERTADARLTEELGDEMTKGLGKESR